MRFSQVFSAALLLLLDSSLVVAFTLPTNTVVSHSMMTKLGSSTREEAETEAERLLRMARKLRQQAEEAEQQIHKQLHDKKTAANSHTDHWIEDLLLSSSSKACPVKDTVQRLHSKQPCMETLERMIDRLHERQLIARGQEHVEANFSPDEKAEFERVSHQKDEAEAEHLVGLIENLISAVEILDDEFSKEHYGKAVAHTENQHWGGGDKAQTLNNRWHEIRRAHEEQFLKRQQSFLEAQRIKDDSEKPSKVHDDHGLLP